jgi:hypothetical protein
MLVSQLGPPSLFQGINNEIKREFPKALNLVLAPHGGIDFFLKCRNQL